MLNLMTPITPADQRYLAALIEACLTYGRPIRDRRGRRLRNLESVVRAILDGEITNLPVSQSTNPEPAGKDANS
jgi:hypothetical protein